LGPPFEQSNSSSGDLESGELKQQHSQIKVPTCAVKNPMLVSSLLEWRMLRHPAYLLPLEGCEWSAKIIKVGSIFLETKKQLGYKVQYGEVMKVDRCSKSNITLCCR
jgi:hypothetical protein